MVNRDGFGVHTVGRSEQEGVMLVRTHVHLLRTALPMLPGGP